MHLHNQRISNFSKYYNLSSKEASALIDLFDKYLGHGYTEEIIALASKNNVDVSSQTVRHIRAGNYKNTLIFKFLTDFATSCKIKELAAQKEIKKNIKI